MSTLPIEAGQTVWVEDYLFTVDGLRRERGLIVLELSIPDTDSDETDPQDVIAYLRREQEFEPSPAGIDYTPDEIAGVIETLLARSPVENADQQNGGQS